MDALYYFVIASVIATFGIGWAVRKAIRDLSNNLDKKENILTSMFIKVAVVEAIPIILIFFGFIILHTSTIDVMLPIVIVGTVTLLNILFISRTSADITNDLHTHKDVKSALKTLTYMGIMLISAIPFITVVAIIQRM